MKIDDAIRETARLTGQSVATVQAGMKPTEAKPRDWQAIWEEERASANKEIMLKRLEQSVPALFQKVSPADLKPALAQWNWEHSLYLHGPVGHGKTHQAASIIKTTGESINWSVEWWYAQDLLNALRDAEFQRGPVPQLHSAKVLVIDDLGSNESPSDYVKQQVLTLIDRIYRERKQKLLITSNLTPDKLAAVFGQRLADRLVELCVVAELREKDGSWRKKLAPTLKL